MRKDVALACQQFQVSERRACKLMGMDRGSYRYEAQAGPEWAFARSPGLTRTTEAAVRISATACAADAT